MSAREIERVRVSLSAPWNWQARVRWLFWRHVARYEYEMCQRCGGRVGPHTGSWWTAPDGLWARVTGDPNGVLCPSCFTSMALTKGVSIRWEAHRDCPASECEPSDQRSIATPHEWGGLR